MTTGQKAKAMAAEKSATGDVPVTGEVPATGMVPAVEGCPPVVAGLDLRKPGLLEASASTGKTYAIEHLVLRLLSESPALELPGILILTFTEKATGELKEKVRSRLAWRIAQGGLAPSALIRLKEAYLNFDRASIFTIHAFCQRVLRTFAFENGALFQTELVKKDQEVFDRVLTEEMRSTWLSDAGAGPEGLSAFRGLMGALNLGPLSKWRSKLLGIAKGFNPLRGDVLRPEYDAARVGDLHEKIRITVTEITELFTDPPPAFPGSAFLAGYRRTTFATDTLKRKAPEVVEAALRMAADCRGIPTPEGRLAGVRAFLEGITLRAVKQEGFGCLRPSLGAGEPLGFPELEALIARLDRLRAAVGAIAEAEKAWDFADQRRVILNLREKARAFKRDHGLIGFDDMIEDVCLALREKPELVRALRQQYRFCLVDEFQDTDPLQWEIFRRVFLESDGANPLYLIGDPKQAIYRFRGGDIHTYLDARKALQAMSREGKAQGLSLGTNFRSSPDLVAACNAVFAHPAWFHAQVADPGDPVWRLPAEPDPLGYLPARHGGLPRQECRDLTAHPEPVILRDFSRAASKPELQRGVNAWIAREIASLMADPSRLLIPDRSSGTPRPIDWGDICILVRTNREKQHLERTLLKHGIPYQINRSSGLYQGEAGAHFLAVLEALEDPRDGSKQALALLTRFFRAPGDPPSTPAPGGAHPRFEEWARLAAGRQWQRLFHSLLYRTGLLYRESLEEDGDRRIMDLVHIAQNLVLEALREDYTLAGLVQRLRDLRSQAPGEEEQDGQREDSEGGKVVLMTLHSSKGLEFPVVFLAAMSGSPPQDYLKYRDGAVTVYNLDKRDPVAKAAYEAEAEGEDRRLFYVALTRARYKLLIPLLPPAFRAFSNGPLGGFVASGLRAAALAMPGLFHLSAGEDPGPDPSLAGRGQAAVALVPTLSVNAPETDAQGAGAQGADLTDPVTFLSDFPKADPLAGADFSRRRRRLASYSHLVRRAPALSAEGLDGRFDKDDAPPGTEALEPEGEEMFDGQESAGEAMDREALGAPGNALPRGRETGNMFHEILEEIDFARAAASETPEDLLSHAPTRELIESRMEEHRVEATHRGDVARVLWHTLSAPVMDPAGGEPFRLGGLKERLPEMEFLFPYPDGYFWGYIDLVFRHRGRYYLLDWKSNWLEKYAPGILGEDIKACRYDLQYMLYALALDKWLGSLLPGYDFRRDFGGIYYVYLRGVRRLPGALPASTGIYALRPTPDQMRSEFPARLEAALGAAAGLAGFARDGGPA